METSSKMPELQPIGRLIIVYLIGLFYGTLVCLNILKNVVVKGPRKVFYVKKRNTRPDVLDNPDFGQHRFARMTVKNLHPAYLFKGNIFVCRIT